MTGIGRLPGESQVGGTRTDETSSSRSESSLAAGEGSQSFDFVVERMRSGPQDRVAPVGSQPRTSDIAVPTSWTGDEIKATKQQMESLLAELDACRKAAMQARSSSEAQELIDQLIQVGSKVLECYASLPQHEARRILSDDQARGLRNEVLHAAEQCNALATQTIYALEQSRIGATVVLERMLSNTPSDQLNRAVSSVANRYADCMEWWGKKALRSERMQGVCAATANLPNATAEMRQADEAALRLYSGWALHTKCMHLQSQVALAQIMIEPHESTFDPATREILMAENGRARLLGTFIADVFPAFVSTSDAVLQSQGRTLDAAHCAVLEGVMERLSEFALGVHNLVSKLSDPGTGVDLPLKLLHQIVEGAWVTAHDVMRLLNLQPKTSTIILPAVDAGTAKPAETTREAVAAEGTSARRKGKSKRTPSAVAGSSARDRTQPQVATTDKATAPAAKVVVLSDLGTKKLVSAEEAHARALSSATAHLAIWQAPPSMEALTRLLARLDALLQFDLAGQQRAVSQARQMKPEDADHVVDTVIERLQTQAAEMQACVASLEEPRRRVLLTPTQVPEVHDKLVRLKMMRAEAQGLAKALDERKASTRIECMKTYGFPSQKYLEQLRAAEELAPADLPRALKGEPGVLFEVKLQPKALRNGAMPSPMWVHIHTKRPVHVRQLTTLDDADFAACHVKSNEQRGYNQQWQNAQAATGRENVVVHRGKLTPAFCKSLLATVHSDIPRYRLAEADQLSTQAARLGI
ncbi:hypothetical protein EOW77_0034255 [Bradyrhizobium yuanmingense]|uniref:hypothetical protein n=1 Tax=Bradyrhizobium yuanmingense TaxID=108015 RepID=UPI000FE3F13A|nr:hypothetical protein [Bradyrhizobium yuanmingense]TGN74165.1 hypothetical protein EOW77_0034255 [Bradyrhizobium yuanmingense]